MASVKIEGNTIQLDDAVCKTNQGIIDALAPFYPAVANATIKRETVNDKTVITVTKKAGSKGILVGVVEKLSAAPEEISPIVAIAASPRRTKTIAAIDDALLKYVEDSREITRMTRALDEAPAIANNQRPIGF